jgi:hypothetical protein
LRASANPLLLLACVTFGAALSLDTASATENISSNRPSPTAANDAVASGDAEYWRSAERIDTVDAFRAYLEVYPNGRYAALARAAIAKAGVSPGDPAGVTRPIGAKSQPQVPQGGAVEAGASLKYFSEPAPHSDAITFKLGDRFTGPGVVTVGWLGAKKQVVLPAGEWIAMAARDHDGTHNKFTTVVFGRLSGEQLITQLLVTLTRVGTPNRSTHWPEINSCGQSDPLAHYQWQNDATSYQRECLKLKAFGGPVLPGPTEDEFRSSLERLGARRSGVMVISNLFFADGTNGFMRIARVDFPAAALGEQGLRQRDWQPEATAQSTARIAYLKALASWMDVYRKFAGEGFRRELSQADLVPGAAAPASSAVMGVGNFEPRKLTEIAAR